MCFLKKKGCLFIIIGVVVCMTACGTTAPVAVPVEHVRTEYVHDTIQRTDSVWTDRWHTEYIKGDTVFIKDSTFKGEYRNLDSKNETVIHDSVPHIVYVDRPVPVPEEHGFIWKSGVALWILIALGLVILVIVLVIKFK